MRSGQIEITGTMIDPPAPAMSVQWAKDHIKSLTSREDHLIAGWIGGATSYFEEQTGRQVCTATREVWLDAFPFVGRSGMGQRIELPYPPLQSVTSVKYVDDDGDTVTLDPSAYRVVAPAGDYCRRGWIEPVQGTSWPTAAQVSAAVQIRIVCGYGDDEDSVPDLVTGVLAFLVGHFEQHRGAVNDSRGTFDEVPLGVEAMMNGFKYSAYPTQALRAGNAVGMWSEIGTIRP